MGPALKGVLERSLFSLGVDRLGRLFRRSDRLVLAYHNVVGDQGEVSGEASLHLPLSRFRGQLDLLSRSCHVVSLADLLDAQRAPDGRPQVALTFDDAYRGAVRLAVPELRRRGLPATIFVAPGMLGDRVFWWDALLKSQKSDSRIREAALEEHRGQNEAVRSWAERAGLPWRETSADARSATASELERAVGDGITVGSHSWSHANLARLEQSECRAELERSMSWLRSRFSSLVPVLSYPYGCHSAATRKVASECGYEAAYRISGGWVRDHGRDLFALPRLNVPAGLSLEGFGLRLAGLLCR